MLKGALSGGDGMGSSVPHLKYENSAAGSFPSAWESHTMKPLVESILHLLPPVPRSVLDRHSVVRP
jgi:hypothetical protein